MGFIKKQMKKIRNTFHIPGEDVILIGLDDRNKSIRIYDLYMKIGSKYESKMESKAIEGNVAQVFLYYARRKLDTIFHGVYDPDDPNIIHVQFDIDKREGVIFKTDDKPEGIAYLVDMQTGQGAQMVRKREVPLMEGAPERDIIETAGPDFSPVIVPQQIKLKRDPIMEILVSLNPYFLGSTIDSFIATELLRGRVEMWKTLLLCAATGIFCLIIGTGM